MNPELSVWAIRYQPADGWSDPEPISASSGAATHALVVDPRGKAIALWTRSDGLGAPLSLWGSRYTAAGGWGTERSHAATQPSRAARTACDCSQWPRTSECSTPRSVSRSTPASSQTNASPIASASAGRCHNTSPPKRAA